MTRSTVPPRAPPASPPPGAASPGFAEELSASVWEGGTDMGCPDFVLKSWTLVAAS